VQGALGALWRARIASGPEEGRVVAIRRIPRSAKLGAEALERITNAGFAAMELRHPKITAVLDVVVAETEIAIVSELIAGAVVQTLLRPPGGKRVSVPVSVALRVAVDVLEAIDAVRAPWAELFPSPESADERRLASGVHGGIVPDDLLIASFGETMLLEAGLAGVALTIPEILDHPDVIAYRAPEQLSGGATIDERADVFTVGILVWELVAGRSLFGPAVLPRPAVAPDKAKGVSDALQISGTRRKVQTAPIQRLDAMPLLKGKVSAELAALVARCLERDPAARFQTAREAKEAFVALGPAAVGPHDAVVKFLATVGASEPEVEEHAPAPPSLSSNRPTVPPAEDPQRQASKAPVASALATAGVPAMAGAAGSAGEGPPGFESVPPTQVDTKAPVTDVDLESIPPSSLDAESLPPSGVDAATLPPSSADAATLPPASREATPVAGFPAVHSRTPVSEASITMMSGMPKGFDADSLPPLDAETLPPASIELESESSRPPPRTHETRSEPPRAVAEAARGPGSGDERRAATRKVVIGVMAVAGVLALLGVMRVLFSGHTDAVVPAPQPTAAPAVPKALSTASASPPPAAPEPVAAPQGSAPAREAPVASPEPAPAAPEPAADTPTLAPAAAGATSAAEAAKKAAKKRHYRPTGI
jgi:serine/threonine protein kinase